jgi:hypothetical protein
VFAEPMYLPQRQPAAGAFRVSRNTLRDGNFDALVPFKVLLMTGLSGEA